MTRLAYVDASAMAKLALDEAESPATLPWSVESERLVSSRVGLIETQRATRRRVHGAVQLGAVLRSVIVLEVDDAIGQSAARVGPATLRTLDAIHLATALALGTDLDAFVTYDDRLAEAARAIGLPVIRPA